MIKQGSLILGLLFANPLTDPSPEFAKWASVRTPSSGAAQSYGAHSAGCIGGAHELAAEGEGYQIVHRSHGRFFGHPNLVDYISQLAGRIRSGSIMIIEDMGYPRGGPFLSGHNSHQSGLDVDISLALTTRILTNEEQENWVSPDYVRDRKYLKANWSTDQVHLIEQAADFTEVNRIFVAPAIKKYFCETAPNAPWLYKIRAWWGHEDHIHVRLSCPADSKGCVSQPALNPRDNGCGTELDWWFSKEADDEAAAPGPGGPRPFPNLPAACQKVLDAK